MKWREGAFEYKKVDDEIRGKRRTEFTLREPEEKMIERTYLVAPGILAKRHTYNPLAKSLAQAGFTSVTMQHEYGSMMCAEDIRVLAREMQWRLQQPVTIVGHSLGGIHAVEAATDMDDETALMLLQSAGFGGVQPLRAIESLLTDRPGNMHLQHELKAVRDGLGYAIKSFRELPGLAHKAGTEVGIKLSAELPDGMDKQAILFPNDRLINSRACGEGLSIAGFATRSLQVRRAGHNAPMYFPHEVADLLITMSQSEKPEAVR